MRVPLFALLLVLVSAPVWAQGEPGPEPLPPKKGGEGAGAGTETQVIPLQAREVIEQLRTMRAQLLLDEEYNRLLEARVKRMELEEKLATPGTPGGGKTKKPEAPRNAVRAPRSLEASDDKQLTVKSVTVAPFKEAFVVYKGRTYTVRPGDKLGNLTIRDITENGVVTNGSTVAMEQP